MEKKFAEKASDAMLLIGRWLKARNAFWLGVAVVALATATIWGWLR